MPSPNTTFRLGRLEDELLQELQRKLNTRSRTDVIRAALHILDRELVKREERVEGMQHQLEDMLPAFDRVVVDEAGFDPRRERAFVRVDDVTYVEAPARPLVFAQRTLEDGTIEKTLVEKGGENPAKRAWIGPVRVERTEA